ncbi:hypothetical protein QQX09_10160 [Demequina sp. SYSU T00192]|uniref:Uncharacterized protein n=1 Tax=Demequina litoralis TaxID=3051660 RepID=A0ABT8GAY3_9MICO|nr:hypothetical protein [Demequina sp. SYSU T00192]MDN4476217.1 hypothetical protein [Demequina sp. SYSU T00192]
MTDPAAEPTDHVDTDEIPVVGAASDPSRGSLPADPVPTPGGTLRIDAAHPFGEDDDADPVVADEDGTDDAPDVAAEHAVAHRPRPVGLLITVALLTVTLLAASALIAYLWRVSEAWEERVIEMTEYSYGLGSELADERGTLATTQEQLDLVSDQLSASKDTVSRLQAENAQWGDDAAYAQEQIAGLQEIITDATSVANSLGRCIQGHEQLAVYLANPDDLKPKELRTFEESVDELCQAAADANLVFQQSVAP